MARTAPITPLSAALRDDAPVEELARAGRGRTRAGQASARTRFTRLADGALAFVKSARRLCRHGVAARLRRTEPKLSCRA